MNRDILFFKVICAIFALIVCVSHRTINTHTNPEIHNASTLLTVYTLENKPTNLIYHIDSGTVYTQGKRGFRKSKLRRLYKHAHIIASTTPPAGKVLGIIKMPQNKAQNTQEKYYVYVK